MLFKDFAVRGIKVIDIIYITIAYFAVGYGLAFFLDLCSEKLYGKQYDTKTTVALVCEIISEVTALTVLAYFARNLIQAIPFPLEGVYGFQHLRVHEVSSGELLIMFSTIFFYDLHAKLDFLRKRSWSY
jgi:hypothetical protein